LHLRGVEGFEGLLKGRPDAEAQVQEFLQRINQVAEHCATEGLFAEGLVILTAGGSDFYDLVVQQLESPSGAHEVLRVIRSGCYLTHDSEYYQKMFRRICKRSPQVNDVGGGLQPALQVWGAVQSLPEPGLAIVTAGKRDLSYDVALPVPELHHRLGSTQPPSALDDGRFQVTALNDQHAYLTIPEDADWQVGDLVGLGISHPCTTFDKWRLLYLVDDDWNVSGGIRTYLA
jgi:D-serine dehydratase